MQRWFFLENFKKSRPKSDTQIRQMSQKQQLKQGALVLSQPWTFSVCVPDLEPTERVYITGSSAELGEWNLNCIVALDQNAGSNVWSKSITIPNTCDVFYRFVIGHKFEGTEDVIVSRWEIHIKPRVITQNTLIATVDEFGNFDGQLKVSRGWISSQTLIQFKFSRNPINLNKSKTGRNMHIKVTPLKMSFGSETDLADESSNVDVTDNHVPVDVYVEVSTLDNNPELCHLQKQKKFGREYRSNDVLLFNVWAPLAEPKDIAYILDLYCYSSRASAEDPPYHVGYVYIMPNMFKQSEGSLELPVTCNIKHRPLGTMSLEYLIIRPMVSCMNNLLVSFAKYWNPRWTGLEVGHRGLGASFKKKEGSSIRENTIASLKKAAASGADLLEFDVQLSKDMIPVVYHDYHICISMKRKKEIPFSDMLQLPVKDLTLEQLQKLKVYHLVELNHEVIFKDDELEEHQPFPTLKHCLKELERHVGFNIELKWNMQLADGSFELENPFDMNVYVDKILEVVLKHAKKRRIVFSCFNPDICTMVRYKQNKYPVMFLTQGQTKKYQAYLDPRCLSIPAAVQSAISSDILGVVAHTEDLLRDPSQVKLATDAGLVIFCWGDENNDKDTIRKLKSMGLHAVIYDKLDEYSIKEIKENVFLLEARESQDLLLFAPEVSVDSVGTAMSSDIGPTPQLPGPYLDLTLRHKIQDISTVTSLSSLASEGREFPIQNTDHDKISKITKDCQVKEHRKTCSGGVLIPAAEVYKHYLKRSRNN